MSLEDWLKPIGGADSKGLRGWNDKAVVSTHSIMTTLLGMVTGRDASVRMIVRMGSTLSMTPTMTRSPPPDDSSTRSPTTKGRDRN